MKKILLICASALVFAISAFSQKTDTLFNQVDSKGLKQGFWKVVYSNGNIKYTAFFKDGKPIGEVKKYFEDAMIKSQLFYYQNSDKCKAKLFYNNGSLAAEGNFWGKEKDSTWNYFSFYNKVLASKETYKHGKKHGVSIVYFPNGVHSEEVEWVDGIKNGTWRQFFQNGSPKLLSEYRQNKRNGEFLFYHPKGYVEIKGKYVNDLMEGAWSYYDEKGSLKSEILYIKGKPLDEKKLNQADQEFFKKLEDNKNKFSEPDINDVMEVKPSNQ
jgi:antitoxin component YwqK of YwqJK toxin-antitoxin module